MQPRSVEFVVDGVHGADVAPVGVVDGAAGAAAVWSVAAAAPPLAVVLAAVLVTLTACLHRPLRVPQRCPLLRCSVEAAAVGVGVAWVTLF